MRVDQIIAVLLLCTFCAGVGWMAGRYDREPLRRRFRHLKRGTSYQTYSEHVMVQASGPVVEGDVLVVYRAEKDGTDWARPASEFFDGRFEELP